jgi:thymidylate kinase
MGSFVVAEPQQAPSPRATGRTGPRLVELVGLAGVGKTTLTNALFQQKQQHFSRKIVLPRPLIVRHALAHSMTFLPHYLRSWPRTSWFSQAELRSMVYLSAWPVALAQQQMAVTTQLMDLGPIYRLAYLQEFGSALTQSAPFASWQAAQIAQWRKLLDLVIVLDAPDVVLQSRIDRRSKKHVVKAGTVAQSATFFRRYRAAYHDILAHITPQEGTADGPLILQIDTSQSPVELIVDQVLQALNQARPQE